MKKKAVIIIVKSPFVFVCQTNIMIFRQLTGFRTFSRTHGGLSESMVGTPKREISPYVSTKYSISAFS